MTYTLFYSGQIRILKVFQYKQQDVLTPCASESCCVNTNAVLTPVVGINNQLGLAACLCMRCIRCAARGCDRHSANYCGKIVCLIQIISKYLLLLRTCHNQLGDIKHSAVFQKIVEKFRRFSR